MRAGLSVTPLISLLLQASLLIQEAKAYNAATAPDVDTKIRKILSDSTLWGTDFAALLANIKSWRGAGETRIEVFQHEAVGAMPHINIQRALSAASRLHILMKEKPRFKPKFEALLQRRAAEIIDRVVPFAEMSRDDASGRVVVLNKSPATQTAYLAPGLTMKTVQERNGSPESVTTRLIDSGDERRPVVLKLYSYAQGSIVFVESDITPTRGAVERVILDMKKISDVIF